MIEKEDIYLALKDVYDPEIRINIVDLGLIYDVSVKKSNVEITMTLTSPNCPASPEIKQDAQRAVRALQGIEDVTIDVVWEPKWQPAMMSDEAKLDLGYDVFCQDERKW